METQPTPALPAMEYAERSDPGRDPDKQVNEDVAVRRETRFGHLCFVCDGMGGHAAGREAAELAGSIILETFAHAPPGAPPPAVLLSAIEQANRGVYAMHTSEVGAGRPGCTVVAALMHGQGTEIGHVGDSRAYLVHEGQIFQITRDHSIVQELVDRGLLTPQQAAHHPDANRITRALGIAADVEVEVRPVPVHHVAGDAFVLCSDGLSDLVEEPEILAIVGSEPAAQAVGKLVDLANARGGHDNITVIVLRARESSLGPPVLLAPTIAQTTVHEAPAAEAIADPPPPFDRAPTPVTQIARAPSTMPPPPRPPASRSTVAVRSGTAVVAIGLLFACVATALLGVMLAIHLAERNGKRNAHSESAIGVVSLDAAASAGPTTLAPESVVLPSPPIPAGEPLAPLEPVPSESRRRKR